jgi:hypothetical protein
MERIKDKMRQSLSAREGSAKRDLGGCGRAREREYRETILLFFARARGHLSYLFFFIFNRV